MQGQSSHNEEVHVIQPVVLCGGSGTRLWPLSRPDRPKPFLSLLGDRTLFQQTLDRFQAASRSADPYNDQTILVCSRLIIWAGHVWFRLGAFVKLGT